LFRAAKHRREIIWRGWWHSPANHVAGRAGADFSGLAAPGIDLQKFSGKRCPGARIVDAKNPEVALLILEMATSRWNCWLSQARRSAAIPRTP
jgi:hypothetical protein